MGQGDYFSTSQAQASPEAEAMIRFDKTIQGTRDSDHYATPQAFYQQLHEEFNFDFDPCPLRSTFDGLKMDWNGSIYVNPPYSNIKPWIEKGLREIKAKRAKTIVYLLPVRTDTAYWHDLILPHATEIRLVKGRLNFNEMKTPAPFPVCLVIFEHWWFMDVGFRAVQLMVKVSSYAQRK
jgi:site-specific DNA-methyltransferase (adenine-specific)